MHRVVGGTGCGSCGRRLEERRSCVRRPGRPALTKAETFAAEPTPDFAELRPRGAEAIEVFLRSGRRVSEGIEPSGLARLVAVL